jgi:hypothetical protein
MSSFKKLNKADVTTVPYAANKRWSFSYTSVDPNDEYIVYYTGSNIPFNASDPTSNNQYASLIYDQINHLFYQSFTSSLDTGSLMFNVNTYSSASQQRPTASYFNYNTNPLLIKQFPSSSGDKIEIYSINQNIYGSKILPNSFQISSSTNNLLIKDDGNGNLYEISQAQDQYVDLNWVTVNYITTGSLVGTGINFIGNIFYAHGIVVNTNSNYSTIYNNATISFQNEHIIYENEVRCIVKESDYNLSYNPTLLKYKGQYITPIFGSNSIMTGSNDSFILTGSFDSTVKDFATGSFFQPYVTTIGLYNDDNELLMVAKLTKPIVLSSDTDMTFIVKYDT